MEYDSKKLEWLEYDILSKFDEFIHATFTRHGGISQEPFNTLNLSISCSDVRDHVLINREAARRELKLSRICYAKQEHGKKVTRVTLQNLSEIPASDALITNLKDVGLAMTHADCQAAIFLDPITESFGVVHAGWRGLAQNIYLETVSSFQKEFGTDPSNLYVAISPALCSQHAEFINFKTEWPKEYWNYQVKPQCFDLREIAKNQLLDAKIPESHIEISDICTFENERDYFSYRRNKKTGRNGTIAGFIKETEL